MRNARLFLRALGSGLLAHGESPHALVRRTRPSECSLLPLSGSSDGRSRSRAFGAAPASAGSAEQVAAIPAPRHHLQRFANQLRHEENFDHATFLIRQRRWGGIAAWTMPPRTNQPCSSAMKLLGSLRDHASLITCARQLVGAGLPAAIAAGDGGRAIRGAAGDLV